VTNDITAQRIGDYVLSVQWRIQGGEQGAMPGLQLDIFWATVCKTVRPMLSVCCLSVLSCPVCLSVTLVYCGQTDQDETLHASRIWPHCVTWGPSSPPPKGHSPPIFGPYLMRPNGCIDQDATRHAAVASAQATLC